MLDLRPMRPASIEHLARHQPMGFQLFGLAVAGTRQLKCKLVAALTLRPPNQSKNGWLDHPQFVDG